MLPKIASTNNTSVSSMLFNGENGTGASTGAGKVTCASTGTGKGTGARTGVDTGEGTGVDTGGITSAGTSALVNGGLPWKSKYRIKIRSFNKVHSLSFGQFFINFFILG
jgi:hypothetical protein